MSVVAARLGDATFAAWLASGEGFGEGVDQHARGADGSGGGDVVCSRRQGLRRTAHATQR
jgi:hypothetical protein